MPCAELPELKQLCGELGAAVNTRDRHLIKGKGVWLMASEASAHELLLLWLWASAHAGLCGRNFMWRWPLPRQLLSEKESAGPGSLQRAHSQCPKIFSVNPISAMLLCLPAMSKNGNPAFTTRTCQGHCRSKLEQQWSLESALRGRCYSEVENLSCFLPPFKYLPNYPRGGSWILILFLWIGTLMGNTSEQQVTKPTLLPSFYW